MQVAGMDRRSSRLVLSRVLSKKRWYNAESATIGKKSSYMSLRLYFPLPLSNFTPHPFIKTAFPPPPLNCFGFFIFKIIFSAEVVEYGKGDNLNRTQIWSNFCYLHKVSHLTQSLLSPILGGILQTWLHIVAEVYWFFSLHEVHRKGRKDSV